MSGDSYFLILISKEGTKYRVYSKPISLKEIDLRTTKYDSKNQLINTIKRNCNIEDEIIDVEILRQPNKTNKSTAVFKSWLLATCRSSLALSSFLGVAASVFSPPAPSFAKNCRLYSRIIFSPACIFYG